MLSTRDQDFDFEVLSGNDVAYLGKNHVRVNRKKKRPKAPDPIHPRKDIFVNL
jgi:hypothetical protein